MAHPDNIQGHDMPAAVLPPHCHLAHGLPRDLYSERIER